MKKHLMMSASLALAALGVSLAPTALAGTTKAPATHTVIGRAELLPVSGGTVRGTATLTLNTKTHQITALVGASGLVPSSSETVSIAKTSSGPILYRLNPLVATSKKVAARTSVVSNVHALQRGWYVTITSSNHAVLAAGAVK